MMIVAVVKKQYDDGQDDHDDEDDDDDYGHGVDERPPPISLIGNTLSSLAISASENK